jgi:arylsulfatase A-like enzyme
MDNTLIIFSSDNGLSMGDHGLLGKQNLYEYGGMHVPLIFAGPGVPHGEADSMAYLHDIFPTACELAGMEPPEGLSGMSLAPVIRGQQEKARTEILTAYKDIQRAWRDERWKIIRYPKIDHTQLFDLENDPHEQNNLAYDPAHAEKVSEMLQKLAAAQTEAGDTCPLTVAEPEEKAWTPPQRN